MHHPSGKGFFSLITILLSIVINPGCEQKQNTTAGSEKEISPSNWNEAISRYPDSIPIQMAFVNHLMDDRKFREAMDSLLGWTEKRPENTTLLNFGAEAGIQGGDTALAMYWMQQSLAASPNQPDILMRMSGILLHQQDSTWKYYRNLLLSFGDEVTRSKGHFINGIALGNENQTAKAIKALDSSIILNFTFTDAYIEKALLLMEIQQYKEALALLYKAMELDRKSSDIHYLIGSCLDKLGNHEQALPYYQNALKLDPSHEGAASKLKELNN